MQAGPVFALVRIRDNLFEQIFPYLFQVAEEEDPPEKNPHKIKSSSGQVFLNNFRWVPDSCHMQGGRAKVHANSSKKFA